MVSTQELVTSKRVCCYNILEEVLTKTWQNIQNHATN